jgi:hypothetical protein
MNQVENWVTISVFSWLPEAEVLKGFLESEGIEAFIPEQYIGSINPMVTAMQVRVQVRTSSVEEAKELLHDFQPDAQIATCPGCGSDDIRIKPTGLKGWFKFVIGALTVTPMRGPVRRVCGACGKAMRPRLSSV